MAENKPPTVPLDKGTKKAPLPGWFPEMMEAVLQEKDKENKIKWHDVPGYDSLLSAMGDQVERLANEVWNLSPVISLEKQEYIIRRCVHIANYAMMIADNMRRAETPHPALSRRERGKGKRENTADAP